MASQFGYSETAAPEIGETLQQLFAATGKSGSLARSANTNILVLCGGPGDGPGVEEYLDALTSLQPGRVFLLCFDEKIRAMEVGISARCSIVAKGKSLCSEIIRLGVSPAVLPAVLSILRGQFLTGRRVEVYALDPRALQRLAPAVYELADVFVFNSRACKQQLELLSEISAKCALIADLGWMGLAAWRSEARLLFDLERVRRSLAVIERVLVRVGGGAAETAVDALLLAAWLVRGLEGLSFECRNGILTVKRRSGAQVMLEFRKEEDGADGEIAGVEFTFGKNPNCERASVIRRGSKLFSEVDGVVMGGGKTIETAATEVDLLKQYLLLGEGLRSYREVLALAIRLGGSFFRGCDRSVGRGKSCLDRGY